MKSTKIIFYCLLFSLILISCGGKEQKAAKKVEPGKVEIVKPLINIYIENSGSMDGYVKGVTEFEQAVFSYLSAIKRKDLTDTLNLYYINSMIFYQKPEIEDFIEKLEPTTFQKRGGNRTYTEISNIIDTILQGTTGNMVSVLVTDGVFSLGGKTDSRDYLLNQQIGVSNDVTEFVKKCPNAAIVVYQLSSNFDGLYFYYDQKIGKETGKYIKEKRPYYIWLMGGIENVSRLVHGIPSEMIVGGGVENAFSVVSGTQDIRYAIRENSGNFKISLENPKTEINKLARDKISKKVQFSVNADFSKLLLDDQYLLDTSNYDIVGNYKVTVTKVPQNSNNYTHSINFTSDRVHKGQVIVRLERHLPEWVEERNDTDGYGYVKDKTFGIYSQLKGVFDAFYDRSKYYTEIKVNIN